MTFKNFASFLFLIAPLSWLVGQSSFGIDSAFSLSLTELIKEDVYNWRGKTIPAYSLTSLNGQTILTEEWRGKPTIVYFLSATSDPEVQEISLIRELKKSFKTNIQTIELSIGGDTKDQDARKSTQLGIIKIIDPETLVQFLGIHHFPKILLLNSTGQITEILDQQYLNHCRTNSTCFESISNLIDLLN